MTTRRSGSTATKRIVLIFAILFPFSFVLIRDATASLSKIFSVRASFDTFDSALIPEVKVVNQDQRSEGITSLNRKAMLDQCQASLVKPVSRIQKKIVRQRPNSPILQSMVKVDGAYRLIFITEGMSHVYASWTTAEGAAWSCDGQPALLHANQSQNDAGRGGTLVITCPLTVQLVTGKKAGGGDIEYNTSLWRACSDHNDLQGIPEASVEKMACTMFKGDHFELAQWIEYHRLIGFQHFLIYLHDARDVENPTTLPDAADITYIPWSFDDLGNFKGAVMHQAVQQMDCIQRAQSRNVTWVALHDVDEYFQIMDNSTLDGILESHESDEHMGGLQLPSWFFGENLSENSTMGSNETKKLVIDSIWRSMTSYRDGVPNAGREKMIIRPRRVVYFACHFIVLGGPMNAEPRIRLDHFKTREIGVYSSSYTKIAKDDSLQMRYGPLLRERLKIG